MCMIWLSIENIQDAMFSYNQQRLRNLCHLFANCVTMIYGILNLVILFDKQKYLILK